MSFTELPDGRFVQIGGEHEDYYDPDFCIYNDVTIHDRSGQFQVLGYPPDVFPPTDFHSATYSDGCISIIGGLGYRGSRMFDSTPVYRLNCQSWILERISSAGDSPGWISKHQASHDGSAAVVTTDGMISREVDGQEQYRDNNDRFRLDLSDMTWCRL